jgi:hypothetical protein
MPGRQDDSEKELERQYELLTDYDRLLGLTVDPLERERYKYNREIVQENIDLLEKGLAGLPGAQVLTAEELLRETVTRKNLKLEGGQQWNFEKLEVRGDLIQAQSNSGIISMGKMGDVSIHHHYPGEPQSVYLTPPPAPDKFGGRDEELQELKALIKKEDAVVLTAMRGLGGIGKTTLAKKVANDLFYRSDEKIFKAVLWKEIKPKPNPLKLLLDWAYLVDPFFLYKDQSLEQLTLQVKGMLESWIAKNAKLDNIGGVLVVFDDVWDDGLEAVRLLRQACPNEALVLITTRSGKVGPLLSAQEMRLDQLEPAKGVKLLLEYIPDGDPQVLWRLAEVLGGHPLAMTLAAKRVLMTDKLLQPQKLVRYIEQYSKGLPAGTPFGELDLELGEDREDNLTKALYYSYAELNPDEQEFFQSLGILPYNAPFDEAMLVDLWGLTPEQLEKPCERLRLLSLLDLDEVSIKNHGGIWYRQHPLVQSYARALLSKEL